MGKVWISAGLGVGAGLLLAAVYLGAPYAGVVVTPTVVMVAAAIIAFGSTISLLTLSALSKPEKKKEKPWRRISDLGLGDYAHFPTDGARLVLRPESVIEEWDIVRNPSSYESKPVLLTIKKSPARSSVRFNPITLSTLFEKLSRFANFEHILLVNEHDEFIGYIPAAYARMYWRGPDAESKITRYVINTLNDPVQNSTSLVEIGGLGLGATIFDDTPITDALKSLSESFFRGFVVYKAKRNRKPLGVIYEADLVKVNLSALISSSAPN